MVCESCTRMFSFMGKIPGMIAKDKDHQYPLILLSLQEVFPHQELELSLFFYCPKSTSSHSFPYFQSTLTGNEIFCPKPWVQRKRIFITCKDIYLSLSKWTTVWGGSNHCIWSSVHFPFDLLSQQAILRIQVAESELFAIFWLSCQLEQVPSSPA